MSEVARLPEEIYKAIKNIAKSRGIHFQEAVKVYIRKIQYKKIPIKTGLILIGIGFILGMILFLGGQKKKIQVPQKVERGT